MRPFQEFRFWARRAPAAERVSAAVATVIVIGLIGWLLVPDGGDDATDEVFASSPEVTTEGGATDGSATTVAVQGGDGGGAAATPEGGSGGSGGGGGGGAAGAPSGAGGGTDGSESVASGGSGPTEAAAAGCVSPPGRAKGVTDKEVKVVVVLTEIVGPAANELFDVPTPAVAKADFEAVVAGINREGGIACRRLVANYVNVNPVDEPGMMGFCRDVADSDVFAVVDTGSLATKPAVLACFGQRQIPYFGAFYITETARTQFYPYLFSFYTKEQLYKSTVFGLKEHGYFDPAKGFKKLGFIYRTCEREAIGAFRGWIREVVPDIQVVTYSVGCPLVFANEADLAQAVRTFQQLGVTHVIPGNLQGDIARFTAHAEQQGYRPKYGIPDEAIMSIASGSRAPDPDNIANAIGITLSREGENHTPGMTPTAGTQRCNEYRKAAKLAPVYDVPANAGHACDQLWMLQAALSRAPEISRAALQVGLQRTKSIDFSFPQGPNDFTPSRTTTGGQFWRTAQFMPDCDCWRVTQRDFRRGFM